MMKQFYFLPRAVTCSVVASVLALSMPSLTFAKSCKDVTIKVLNRSANEVKLTKLEYLKDGENWLTENVFGLDGHQKLEPNVEFKTTRNLQRVGSEITQVRLTFERHLGGSKWEKAPALRSSAFACPPPIPVEFEIQD